MAGPKAPQSSLGQHAHAARGLFSNINLSRLSGSRPAYKKGVKANDSSSESESGSSSADSSADNSADNSAMILKQLNESSSAPKTKVMVTKKESAMTTNASAQSIMANGLGSKARPAAKKIAKSATSSDSSDADSESDSDFDSDSDDDANSQAKATGKPIQKENEEKATSASRSDSSDAKSSSSDTDSESDSLSDKNPSTSSKVKTNPISRSKGAAKNKIPQSPDESSSEGSSCGEVKRAAISKAKGYKLATPRPTQSIKSSKIASKAKTTACGQFKSKATVSDSTSDNEPVPNKQQKKASKKNAAPKAAAKSIKRVSPLEEVAENTSVERRNHNGGLFPYVAEIIAQDFRLQKAEDELSSLDVYTFFKNAKNEGKQIWYFTAPAHVPIEVVQKSTIPMDKVQQRQTVFSYNGNDFSAGFDATSTSIKVIIPAKDGSTYNQSQPVSRVMHIKQVTRFVDSDSSTAVTQTLAPPTCRPQPDGLKNRFLPIGVSGPLRKDDVEMAEASSPLSSSKKPEANKKRKQPNDAEHILGHDKHKEKKTKKLHLDKPKPTPKATSKKASKTKKTTTGVTNADDVTTVIPTSQPTTVTPIPPPILLGSSTQRKNINLQKESTTPIPAPGLKRT